MTEDNGANGVSEPSFVFFVAVTEPFAIFRRVDVDLPLGKWEFCNLITI